MFGKRESCGPLGGARPARTGLGIRTENKNKKSDMKGTTRILWTRTIACAIAATLYSARAADDSISQAEKSAKDHLSFGRTRAIAEEGFIYGLPLVMNYAVNY